MNTIKNQTNDFNLLKHGIIVIFILLKCTFSIAQADTATLQVRQDGITITGTVTNEKSERLQGATVTEVGTANGVVTNSSGNYSIKVLNNNTVLRFSYTGYQTVDIEVGNKRSIDVILEEDETAMSDVVVTGYMAQRKADLTGAVSVVTQEDIAKNPSASVMRSMQGKIPGVFIRTDGNPAENVWLDIRGQTSINSSPPLIVLDGQPVDITLRDINPNDIASMQILKDASSASIYGSRAAGGVILITTKKGKKGTPVVTYEGYVGVSKITGVPEMLDTQGYGRALWQATVNDGKDVNGIRIYNYDWNYDANGIPVLNKVTPVEWLNDSKTMPSANTNWFKEGTRTGLQQNHQLTIMGGTERSSNMFSLNYYNNDGTQITSFFRRLSARLNSEYELIKGRLTIGENLTLTNLRMRDRNRTYEFMVMPPNIPVYANDGMWGGVAMKLGMDDFNNPIRDLRVNEDNVPVFNKVLGSVYANLNILNNLTFRTQYGIDYSMWYQRYTDHKWEEAGGKFDDLNGIEQLTWQRLGQTWTNTLLYNLVLGKNKIDLLAGVETFRFLAEDFRGYRGDLVLETRDYAYLGGASSADRFSLGGGGDERTMLSYFGKVNYDYNGRYLLSATLRRDGSSVFGENNRFGTFPAFSAGWRISSEDFFSGLKDKISDLKLRVSWGQNGNSAPLSAGRLVNIYLTDPNSTSYDIKGVGTGALLSGYRRDRIGNPNLKWETTTQVNLGLDFSFFTSKLSGSFDLYNKKTTDMLYEPPYIAALGEGGYRWINAADMENKGFELVLSWRETVGDFYYNITANASAYKNKITHLPENAVFAYPGNGLLDNILGRPVSSMYGLVADGIFKTQQEVNNAAYQPYKGLGRLRFKDLDGDGSINEIYDRTWIGKRDPDLMAGLNFDARYKNVDLSFFLQGLFGNDVINDWKRLSHFWNIDLHQDRNHPASILNAWSPLNPDSDIPALSRANNGEGRFSSYFVESGSYIKMRYLELGYNLPALLVNRWSISRFRIYAGAQNLFTIKKTWGENQFTGPDPENPGTGYPMPFTVRFGVSVTF